MTITIAMTVLIATKVTMATMVTIPVKYSGYQDVFLSVSVAVLPKHSGIDDHPINLVDNKQPSYAISSHPPTLRTLFICKMDGSL